MNTYKFILNGKVINTRKNNRIYNYAKFSVHKYKDNYFLKQIEEKLSFYKDVFKTKNFELLRLKDNGGCKKKTEFLDQFKRPIQELIGIKHPMRNFETSYDEFIDQFTWDNFVVEKSDFISFKNFWIGTEEFDWDWTHKGNFLSGNKRSKEEIESLVPTKKINITNGRQYCKLKPTTYTEINFSRNNNFDVGKDYLLNNKENMDFYLQTIVPVINGVAEYTDSKVKVVQ